MQIQIPRSIQTIIKLIEKSGYQAYIVGGFVRDSLLNIKTHDIDIASNATPLTIKKILNRYYINERFIKYGCLVMHIDKYEVEITTFRKENGYMNHRTPKEVVFCNSVKDDYSRRDFTINALYCNNSEIIDLCEGINDLNNKIIRIIGNADVRFEEDCLRIMRAMRFASSLGFEIEEKTKQAIKKNYFLIKELKFNILYREIKGILKGKYFINVLKEYKEQLKDIFNLSDLRIELFNDNMNYLEREAIFFYFSNQKIGNIYLKHKEIIYEHNNVDLKKKLFRYGYEDISKDIYFKGKYFNGIKEKYLLKDIIKNNECFNLKMLDINGNDLLQFDVKKSKISTYLEVLLILVIENKIINDKKILIDYFKKNMLKKEG